VSHEATATLGLPAPTAIEPSRVLVLNDDEQRLLLDALDNSVGSSIDPGAPLNRLHSRIAYGDEYVNAKDELARVTLRKRRLEGEIRRCNMAIERCEEQVVEEFIDEGSSGFKHDATGANLILDRKVWVKLDVDTEGLPKDEADRVRREHKARAADGLIAAGLGDYVKPDFNSNSVSAYFRELIKTYAAEQRELPEHQRTPLPAEAFLPDQLRGLLVIDDSPSISVRA
jgi:hypothetical protein